jgi:hypothetical protein
MVPTGSIRSEFGLGSLAMRVPETVSISYSARNRTRW